MKCLYELSVKKLNELVLKNLHLKNWFVRDDKIENRHYAIVGSERFEILKKRASSMKYIFNDTEIVTWLDTLCEMYYVFSCIEDEHLKDNIVILQEYCIPFSNKRADYLLVYDDKILIVEFSFRKLGYEFNYETKLLQATSYKELLGNILPKDIEIGTYTFLLKPEEDKNGNAIYVNGDDDLPNNREISLFAEYIEKFFNKNIKLAYNSLKQSH